MNFEGGRGFFNGNRPVRGSPSVHNCPFGLMARGKQKPEPGGYSWLGSEVALERSSGQTKGFWHELHHYSKVGSYRSAMVPKLTDWFYLLA
jgi:hypothetical protein